LQQALGCDSKEINHSAMIHMSCCLRRLGLMARHASGLGGGGCIDPRPAIFPVPG